MFTFITIHYFSTKGAHMYQMFLTMLFLSATFAQTIQAPSPRDESYQNLGIPVAALRAVIVTYDAGRTGSKQQFNSDQEVTPGHRLPSPAIRLPACKKAQPASLDSKFSGSPKSSLRSGSNVIIESIDESLIDLGGRFDIPSPAVPLPDDKKAQHSKKDSPV